MKILNIRINLILIMFMMAVCSISTISCDNDELEIKKDFPFDLKVLPIPKDLANGESAEIRINIQQLGSYNEGEYYLRYFQFDGKGTLRYFNEPPYKPNDLYLIPDREFRLYYTSLSNVSQSFDVWISDGFGNEKQVSFQFNSVDQK